MNVGTLLIAASFAVAFVSLYFHIRGARGNVFARVTAERLCYLSGGFIFIAAALLMWAFIDGWYQYAYVYSYSSRELPLTLRIAAFWAGQEGTFLLWAALLQVFGVLVIRASDEDEGVLMTVITVTQIFILFVLLVNSPFRYVWQQFPEQFSPANIPHNGAGLNPLLQDFWMVIHPPVLFLGYASATVPFAYAIAALVKREYASWVRKAYRWIVFSMASLGVGIFLGGYWAYKVLGWGGYWGWDPVENSSLIPWLVIVALTHGAIVQRRRQALVKTNIALALMAFILIFYATFLTRSGVLSNFSVHSFGDLGITRHLVFFMAFFAAVSVGLFAWRARGMHGEPLGERALSWDTLMAYGVITLCFYAFLILVGTSMPILSTVFGGRPFSVQQGYYNNMSMPLGLLVLGFIALAGVARFSGRALLGIVAALLAVSAAAGIAFNLRYTDSVFAYVFSAFAVFVALASVLDIVQLKSGAVLPSRLCHIGVALLVLGVVASNAHSTSHRQRLALGATQRVGGVELTFRGIAEREKSALMFTMDSGRGPRDIETFYYIEPRMNSLYREPCIVYGFGGDIYISPIEFTSGIERLTRVELTKGEEASMQDFSVRFEGFDIDRERMLAGEVTLFAKLHVVRGGAATVAAPGVKFSGDSQRQHVDAYLPWGKRRVSLLDFNVNEGRVLVHVDTAPGAAVPPDTALVEVSFKRLIWLVWIGTVFIAAGGVLAMRRFSGA